MFLTESLFRITYGLIIEVNKPEVSITDRLAFYWH